METKGIDTIRGLVGEPPKSTEMPHKIMETAELIRQAWNALYIAFLPFCFKCKLPLTWHTPPEQDRTIFHCEGCGRKWTLGEKDDKGG